MAFCTECGAKLPENAQFCTNCGEKQRSAVSDGYVPSSDETDTAAAADNDTIPASENQSKPDMEQAAPAQTRYYTPPSRQGFIPPYQPGLYGAPEQPVFSPAPVKKSGGKAALIIILCVVALAVGLILLLHHCSAGTPSDDYLGYWESEALDLGSGSFADEYYGNEVAAMMGLQINSDGSMYLGSIFSPDIIDGRWTQSASGISATLNGQPVYISYSDDALILQDGRTAILFERATGDINSPSIPFGSFAGSGTAPELPSVQETPAPGNSPSAISGSGDVAKGQYHISVVGAEKSHDLDDKPVIRFYYEFTNCSEHSEYAWNALDFEVTQDGKALEATYTWDENVPEYYNNVLSVRPGVTILCISEYNMDPDGGRIDYTVFGWDEGKSTGSVTASFLPDSLPGRPALYEIKPVESPAWTLSIPAEGILDELYYVEVKNAALVTDNEGNAAIRVFYSFKNSSNTSASMTGSLFCMSYQDGVQLDETNASDSPETDNLAYQEIKPGETVNCSLVFRLRSKTAPVEAEVEAGATYNAVGQTFPIA